MFDPSKISLDLENTDKASEKALEKEKHTPDLDKNVEKIQKNEIVNEIKNDNYQPSINANEGISIEKVQENKQNREENQEIPENTDEKTETVQTKDTTPEEKTIFNINISCLQDLLVLLVERSYDFVILEPETNRVKISYRKDKIEKEGMYIPYPIYSKILLKAKAASHLKIDETEKEQEGSGEIALKNKAYKIVSKTVPSELGEKIFLKMIPIEKQVKKQAKKADPKQMLITLGTFLLFSILIAGIFITFVVLNAKNVADVAFFENFGISLNDINDFIKQITTIAFSILMLIETIFLFVFLFKFSLTKKEFKQKKVRYGILSSFFVLLALGTMSGWLVIEQKVSQLPKWLEMSYGTIQVYDNSKLISESFDRGGSLLKDTSNLIAPIDIKFDLSYLAEAEEKTGNSIKKYIWNFGDKTEEETSIPTLIKSFDKKGNYEVSLIIESIDRTGEVRQKQVEGINNININHKVDINEKVLNSGGKIVSFDAKSLNKLGKIEWYANNNFSIPERKDYTYTTSKPVFDEEIILMRINSGDENEQTLDKVFIISEVTQSKLQGEISYERSAINPLEYTFQIDNIGNELGVGIIENFLWTIGDKEYSKLGDPIDQIEASSIKHIFKEYGPQTVEVTMTNSSGEEKTITRTINIPQNLQIKNPPKILNEGEEIQNIEYIEQNREYYINDVAIPTTLSFDATRLRTNNIKYSLTQISWDLDGDGTIDSKKKSLTHTLNTPGTYKIFVNYTFTHKQNPDDIIEVKESYYIEAIEKDAIIQLDIKTPNNYAPVVAKLDASKSKIAGENIIKFIWDYGDGIIEEKGEGVVYGHLYKVPGEYDITVTAVGENGVKYSKTKKLILIPKPQTIDIQVSKRVTIAGQGIDFGSSKSTGQIVSYLWDFGDNSTSTEANPSHSYKQPGEYTVTLRVDFSNNNTLEETIKIKVLEEY